MTDNQKRRVLADHKRVGKRFIPPFLQLGDFQDVRWVDKVIPEILWIALLHESHGIGPGAELALELGKAAAETISGNSKVWFGVASAFETLPDESKAQVVSRLETLSKIEPIRKALAPLVHFYPKCPLRFLIETTPGAKEAGNLSSLKATIAAMFPRNERFPMMAQATAVYIAFCTGKLVATRGTSLAEFPEVQHYPGTEKSRLVGASVRTTVTMLCGHESGKSSWPQYFWNTGLSLESCSFGE